MLNALIKYSTSAALIFSFLAFTVVTGCKKSTPVPEEPNKAQSAKTSAVSTEVVINNSPTIQDIVSKRTGWNPILESYYGKEVPDLQLTDINGKTHKLSDYRGKNVMVIFWATWCMPCMEEVPHLNTLRDVLPEDKLAMLAISTEDIETVKRTAEGKNMKYTVIATQQTMPKPFSEVKGIPTAFFIRPDGKLKLVTEGSAYYGEMKSILAAE